MTLPRFRSSALPLLTAAIALATAPAEASRFAIGTQWESWHGVELDASKDPANKYSEKIGLHKIEFDVPGITNYYLEEPGFLFSLIAGAAGSEANEINARNEAVKKGEHVYQWSYAQPPAIPDGRWFRWGYSHAFADGGTRTVVARALSNGKDTTLRFKDPKLRFDYMRFDANMVTAPRLIGNSDFYYMFGSDFSGTSLKIYGGTNPTTVSGAGPNQVGDDWSFATMPLNLHMGWQPRFFPYLMVEANGGFDFIDPISCFFGTWEGYTPYTEFGGRATLGTDWISVYADISHEVDPLWDGEKSNRSYSGLWTVFGARLDLGNLFMKLF